PGVIAGGVPGGIVKGIPGDVGAGSPGGVQGPAIAKPRAPRAAQASPQPPQAPAPLPAPGSNPQREDEIRKKIEDLQRSVVKRREEEELRRKQLLENLAQIKVYLIEALVNHGDSLTHVRPNEYVNLVLIAEEGDSKYFKLVDEGEASTHREVVSVQKS